MIGILLTARMNSTRIQRKMIKNIGGIPIISYGIEKAKAAAAAVGGIPILCTTENVDDKVLCAHAVANGIEYFRGSEMDKIQRYHGALAAFDCDYGINIDGDDPFTDLAAIARAAKCFVDTPALDYVYDSDSAVIGAFTHGFSFYALHKICCIKKTSDTEMIRPYFTQSGLFNFHEFCSIYDPDRKWRFTIDYPEDVEFFNTVIGAGLYNISAAIEHMPDSYLINTRRNADYLDKQQRITKLCL